MSLKSKGIGIATLTAGILPDQNYFFPNSGPNPIFIPKKHTIETYRSQQKKAKKRKNKKK